MSNLLLFIIAGIMGGIVYMQYRMNLILESIRDEIKKLGELS